MTSEGMPREPGIYAIINRVNGHRYVGQARNIRSRIAEHLRALRSGQHFASLERRFLQDAWNEYGEDAFEAVVLELVRHNKGEFEYSQRADNLSLAEQYFIGEKSEYNPDKAICAARHRNLVESFAWREPAGG